MADTKTPKKLTDLRVVDLRTELEQRGLEKTGVKAALIERLTKALEGEGHDPDAYEFTISDKKGIPVKKINGDTEGGAEKQIEDVDEEMAENVDTPLEEPVAVEAEPATEESAAPTEAKVEEKMVVCESIKPAEEDMETEDSIMADAKVLDEVTDEDAINISIEDEDKLLADDDEEDKKDEVNTEAKKESVTASEVNGDNKAGSTSAKADESNKENAGKSADPEVKVSNPPSPTSVPVPQGSLTADDLLKLHTVMDRKDDDISLVVHVDDTQNDLDNDLLNTPMKKTGDTSEDTAATASRSEKDVVDSSKATGEAPKASADKKQVAPSPKKPAVDPKKVGTGSDAKKTDVKKEDTAKKTPEKKADGKKDGDKKDGDRAKSDSKTTGKTPSKDEKGSSSSSSRNLWVSGLSSSTRATDLKTLFTKHGKVVGAKVVTNPRSPGSRCYGFVTMSTTEEASRCIQHLHRTELHGRMISVERAKNEPSVHPPPATPKSSRPASTHHDKREPRKDDKAADKKDPKQLSEKKEVKPVDKKDEKKEDGKKEEKKDDGKKPEVEKKDEKKDGEKREEEKKEGEKEGEKKDAEKKDGKKEGEKKDDKHSHRHSSTSRRSDGGDRRPDNRKPGDTRDRGKERSKEDVLSFQKIKAERERERLKQHERRLREEQRWRARDMERERQRQREIAREQKEEADRLQRERDKIRMERERLERERIAMERADREGRMERERRERERMERERDEARRMTQMRMEHDRRPPKRPYDRAVGAGRDSRDDHQYWSSEPKRPTMATDRPFSSSNFSDARGFGDFGDHHRSGLARGGYEDGMDRRVDRYERKDTRPLDSGARHADTGRFDSHRDDSNVRRSRDVPPSRDAGPSRDRDDRRFEDRRVDDRRQAAPERSFERYDDRGMPGRDGERDRRVAPERRDVDRREGDRRLATPDRSREARADWKGDSRGMGSAGRDSHRDRATYESSIVKGSTAGGREPWGVDSRKESWGSSNMDSQNVSRQSDRWASQSSADRGMSGIRGSQHSSSSIPVNTPLLQTPSSNQNFLTSAANIMMGVGMASNRSSQDDRYNAYKNISGGNVRRY